MFGIWLDLINVPTFLDKFSYRSPNSTYSADYYKDTGIFLRSNDKAISCVDCWYVTPIIDVVALYILVLLRIYFAFFAASRKITDPGEWRSIVDSGHCCHTCRLILNWPALTIINMWLSLSLSLCPVCRLWSSEKQNGPKVA